MQIPLETLNKESPVTLPKQLKQILQQRIETGYYTPGRKIDSVRKISAEFKVSSLTVQRALKQLESEGFVVSVPASGIFVNEQFATEKEPMKMAFVFPETEISLKNLPPENWAIASEIYRGLLSGGKKYGAQIDFVYVDKDMEMLRMLRQVKHLSRYEALFFAGEQLRDLQLELSRKIPVFHFSATQKMNSGLIDIDYDKEAAIETLVRHACECGCKTAATISHSNFYGSIKSVQQNLFYASRVQSFLKYCRKYRLETPDGFQIQISSLAGLEEKLVQMRESGYPDFIFYNHTESIPHLYEACAEHGIRIGQDFKMAAIASGFTFHGLVPSLTYVRVPMFELAENAIRDACTMISGNLPVSALKRKEMHAVLIPGKSTVNDKTHKE